MNQDVKLGALAELARFESAVFRFGHQVRAFLDALPGDFPTPSAVLPRFGARTPAGCGEYGSDSYVHVIPNALDDVAAWAALLGVPVTEKPSEYGDDAVSLTLEGPLDGLTLYISYLDVGRARRRKQAQTATGAGTAGGGE